MKNSRKQNQGVTLLEILMVLVIVSSILFMGIGYIQQRTLQTQLDRSSVQMQQILAAAMAYHVANGVWPLSLSCLQGDGTPGCTLAYLPSSIINPLSPGTTYQVTETSSMFTVSGLVSRGTNSKNVATILVGRLPLGWTSKGVANQVPCPPNSTGCYANASVSVPSESIQNIGNVSFAGLYHHGACVPAPDCPLDAEDNKTQPRVFLVPVSVSGVNDAPEANIYPISSFTAYTSEADASDDPEPCNILFDASTGCGELVGDPAPAYWRACMQVVTEKGDVAQDVSSRGSATDSDVFPTYPWGGNVTMAAFTRCEPNDESAGSAFTVFTN